MNKLIHTSILVVFAFLVSFVNPVFAEGDAVYTLVLLRHGESMGNMEKMFTGWTDVELTDQGRQQAAQAGTMLKETGIKFDEVHTSKLIRAIETSQIALKEMKASWLPVSKYWRLNERCYGALEGRTRDDVKKEVGDEQVKIWRRSFDVPPPPFSADDPRSPAKDPRYSDLDPRVIPASESLKEVIQRVGPYWTDTLRPAIMSGRTVLVVGHSTGLRALTSWIQPELDEAALQKTEISNATPIIYEFDKDMKVVSRKVMGTK